MEYSNRTASESPNRMREKDPNPEDGGTPNRTGVRIRTEPSMGDRTEPDVYFYYSVMTILKTNSNSIKPEMQRKSK